MPEHLFKLKDCGTPIATNKKKGQCLVDFSVSIEMAFLSFLSSVNLGIILTASKRFWSSHFISHDLVFCFVCKTG